MQKIKSFGDSFIYGSDLKDNIDSNKHSKNTWPALIAKKIDATYHCHAQAGASNSAIARQVLEYADQDSLNVIQWTWIDRTEFFDIDNNQHIQIYPKQSNDINKYYYKHLHSEIQDKWMSLSMMHSTLAYLKNNNMPYVCHVIDRLMLMQKYQVPAYITNLQKYLKSLVTWFPDFTTFFEWSKLNKFDISDAWHPLEQAHQQAFNIMLELYHERFIK